MNVREIICPFAPKPVIPDRFFASSALTDLACPQRLLWKGDHTFEARLGGSPVAALGTVTHKLIERATKGQVNKDHLADEFDRLVTEAEHLLLDSTDSKWMVPLRDVIRGYDLRRFHALREAASMIVVNQGAGDGTGHQWRRSELKVDTSDGLVRCYIDQVEETALGVVLRDFKTGKLTDPDTNRVIEAYRIQMLLCAAAYEDSTEVWPERLELVGINGEIVEVSGSRSDANVVLSRLRKYLNNLEKWISSEIPANPSPASCRWCTFRVCCDQYQSTSGMRLSEGWPNDLKGDIVKSENIHRGIRVTLHTTIGEIAVRIPDTINCNFDIGETVGLFDMRHWQGDLCIWRGSTIVRYKVGG